jgi:hypothetical protein
MGFRPAPGMRGFVAAAHGRNGPISAHSKVSILCRRPDVKWKYGFVIPTAAMGPANWQLEYTTARRHRPALDLTRTAHRRTHSPPGMLTKV